MDPIRPIGPHDIEVDPILRVERASQQERERQQRERRERERRREQLAELEAEPPAVSPEPGDDGEQHIDIRV